LKNSVELNYSVILLIIYTFISECFNTELFKDGNGISVKVDEVNDSDDNIRIAQFNNMQITEKIIDVTESSLIFDGKVLI
jgi:hypothetical protein